MGTGRPPGNYNPHDKNGRFTKGQQYPGPIRDTHYGWKDKVVRSNIEYATDADLLKARDERLREEQIAHNKVEAEQRAFDESYRWVRSNPTTEEKELQRKIKEWESYVKLATDETTRKTHQHQLDLLIQQLNTSIGKRALKYRKNRGV